MREESLVTSCGSWSKSLKHDVLWSLPVKAKLFSKLNTSKWGQRNISTSQPNVLQKTPCFLWGCWAEALVGMLWMWGWAQCCLGRCRMLLAEMLFEVPLPCFTKCRCAQKDISTLTRGENVYAIGKAVAVPSSATLWLWASCSTPQYSNLPPVVLHR